MGLRYRVSLPGPFYYSGRVGPEHWLPRSSSTGTGSMGFVVKWFIVYPSIVCFGAGLAVMLAPFYGVFWVVRRSLRNRQRCRPVAQCFPVQRPLLQRPAQPAPYGLVPAQRPVPAPAHAPARRVVAGEPLGSDSRPRGSAAAHPGCSPGVWGDGRFR